MKKIAVICAFLPDRNTGMTTVDLAAHSVLPRLAPDAEITFYTFGKIDPAPYAPGVMPYKYIDIADAPEDYLNSDVFIFWGDFIHSHSYWKFDRVAWNEFLQRMDSQSKAAWMHEQYQLYSRFIFLSEQPIERLKNAIVFGSTIITNDASDEADTAYTNNYSRFFKNIGAVFFRDALSASKISPLRLDEPTLACDCALLLQDSDIEKLPDFYRANSRDGIGVFFGRTPSKLKMFAFVHLLSKKTGEKCSWVPWFTSQPRIKLLARLFGYNVADTNPDPGKLLAQLTSYKFVVTDTYHMCVNAWRLGIPAVCIGNGAQSMANSLADKKKEIFYEMYGAREFYVFRETLQSFRGMAAAATNLASVVKNEGVITRISITISAHRKMAEHRLGNALRKLLTH